MGVPAEKDEKALYFMELTELSFEYALYGPFGPPPYGTFVLLGGGSLHRLATNEAGLLRVSRA